MEKRIGASCSRQDSNARIAKDVPRTEVVLKRFWPAKFEFWQFGTGKGRADFSARPFRHCGQSEAISLARSNELLCRQCSVSTTRRDALRFD